MIVISSWKTDVYLFIFYTLLALWECVTGGAAQTWICCGRYRLYMICYTK